ncbi:MAG TPA: OsmC family peroxiredoxin [Polyangiales bacterium]|nr:OsmC family peroxiredoxin [Polyangiales bacterium]
MKRGACAIWEGALMGGAGRLTTDSRLLADSPFSFTTRFGDAPGTNPEELIAAAHAGCFSMALAFLLGEAKRAPESIRTAAELSFENVGTSWTVTGIHLSVVARVPGMADPEFQQLAEQAKRGCLVSRLVVVPVTLEARLAAEINDSLRPG